MIGKRDDQFLGIVRRRVVFVECVETGRGEETMVQYAEDAGEKRRNEQRELRSNHIVV